MTYNEYLETLTEEELKEEFESSEADYYCDLYASDYVEY